MTLETRDMQRDDVPACVAIINHTITLGGTTVDRIIKRFKL